MVSLMISFQLLVNVAMVIGIFPIVGIPLPLLSYGGSSLLANFLGVGLVLNVKMRRFVNI
jgi:rod shape determining protein RodA